MAITAKSRSRLRLRAASSLDGADLLLLVKQATGSVKGGGASVLTSGWQNLGAQVHVEREGADYLALSIKGAKRFVELCTFSARVSPGGTPGTNVLTVGGLQTYRTSQEKLLYLIPVGPKMIAGMAPYRRFLEGIEQVIRAKDPAAQVEISVPETG